MKTNKILALAKDAILELEFQKALDYPEEVWRKRLANYLHEFSQYGQSNYARMMAREDYLTAGLCIGKAIESAMDIAYVLCRQYAPYYKWKRKGLENLGEMQDVLWICDLIQNYFL